MYRSNRSFNIPPGISLFWKLLFKFSPIQAKMPFKCPTLGSIQVIKCPHSGDIHRHMNDRRTENTPSVVEQNIYIYSSLRASSAVWASEASLARTHERGPILCHSRLRRSLTRSRETCFARPNRRACSQAINTANNSHQSNKLKTKNHSVSVFTMSKTMSVPHGHCKFWCYDSKILFWISKSHLQF